MSKLAGQKVEVFVAKAFEVRVGGYCIATDGKEWREIEMRINAHDELVAALERIAEEHCVKVCGQHISDSDKGGGCLTTACAQAKAALAKVRGQSGEGG